MAALRISKDVVATKRWAKENPPARLPNNGDVIIQGTRSVPRIQHSRRTVSQRAIERVFSSNRNRGRRRSLDFFLEWRERTSWRQDSLSWSRQRADSRRCLTASERGD